MSADDYRADAETLLRMVGGMGEPLNWQISLIADLMSFRAQLRDAPTSDWIGEDLRPGPLPTAIVLKKEAIIERPPELLAILRERKHPMSPFQTRRSAKRSPKGMRKNR